MPPKKGPRLRAPASSMRRGRAQVVHSYAPGKTFDYERGYCVSRIVAISGTQPRSDEQLGRVRESVWHRIERWQGGTFGLPKNRGDLERLYFLYPQKVFFDVWPLAFVCKEPGCRRTERFRSADDLFAATSNRQGTVQRELAFKDGHTGKVEVVRQFRCGRCGSGTEQSRYLLIHDSGDAEGVAPPPCPHCNSDATPGQRFGTTPSSWNIRLDERGSERAADFRWVCISCRQVIGETVTHSVPKGPDGKSPGYYRLLPHRANAAYHTQSIRIMPLSDEDYVRYVKTDRGAKVIVNAYVESRVPGPIGTEPETASADSPIVVALRQRLMEARMKIDPRSSDKRAKEQVRVLEEMLSEEEAKTQAPADQVTDGLLSNPERLEELVEYTTIPLTARVRSIADLVQTLEAREPGAGARAEAASRRFRRLGIAKVELVDGFRIYEAAFGFTRGEGAGQLRGFNVAAGGLSAAFCKVPGGQEVGFPCYLLPADTEALRVTFSPAAVASWLRELGHEVPAENASEPELRQWFLTHTMRPGPRPVGSGNVIADETFTMLHSAAHIFIRGLSGFSGLRTGSLSEYLFPHCLAFVVYVNKLSFNAGNLRAVFEQALDRFAGALVADPLLRVCPHDPICLRDAGACTACLHLADQSCDHANKLLSRVTLFGNEYRRGLWWQQET